MVEGPKSCLAECGLDDFRGQHVKVSSTVNGHKIFLANLLSSFSLIEVPLFAEDDVQNCKEHHIKALKEMGGMGRVTQN